MQTICLYGHLGARFGRVHRYDVHSVSEAVRAMCVTLEGFRKAVVDGGYYKVLVGGKDALSAKRLGEPVSTRESIRIVPVIAGAGKYGQIILGAILITASFFAGPVFGPYLMNAGIAMMIGGVAQLLFAPKPAGAPPDRPENKPSYSFDGAVNTAAQGNPVPVLYGKLIVGSQVISAGLSVEQI